MLRLVAFAVFFASGFAALLYQVIWQRMLAIFSGADVYSATIIVAAFMGGLGVGHLAGGQMADRVSARASLALFGLAEAAIAGFGLVSAALYYDYLYQQLGPVQIPAPAIAAILFGSLLWPTFWMGASLPLLARALTTHVERTASIVGSLYGFNTLGAAAGAFFATWWLLPRFGLEGALSVGAALNLASAILAVPLALRLPSSRAAVPVATTTIEDRDAPAFARRDSSELRRGKPAPRASAASAFWFWLLAYGFAGFVALSLEIVWFRVLGVMMKSTAFTFGTLLAIYLGGVGCGALAGSVVARRVRRPDLAFFTLQAGSGLSAAALMMLMVWLAGTADAFRDYFGSYEPLNVRDSVNAIRAVLESRIQGIESPIGVPANFVRMYIGVPLLLVFPPTFLMGCSFPVLQRLVHADLAHVGRRVGALLLANIAGSMLGAIMTGWLSLAVLGTAGTLKLLMMISGVYLLLAMRIVLRGSHAPRALLWPVAIAGLGLAVLVSIPDTALLWARLHGTTVNHIVVGEDDSGVSVIKTEQRGMEGTTVVFVNGLGQSTIPYGDVHTALGALPAFLHPNPTDALIIGLGSGDTVYAVGGRPGVERITSVEIIRPQIDTLRALIQREPYPALRALLLDNRVEHVFGDGRAHLLRRGRTYDIVEADALRPTSAYSGNLYSEEYFTLVKDHLRPKGLAATWVPTERVYNAFVRVFPYVVSVPGVLVGSKEPLALDRAAIERRLDDPRVRTYYDVAGIDIRALFEHYLREPGVYGPDFPRDTLTDFNTDLFPKDEYDLRSNGPGSPLP